VGTWEGRQVINPKPLSVTAAIMIDDSGSLLLARRPAEDRLARHWELPGGKVLGSARKPGQRHQYARRNALVLSVGAVVCRRAVTSDVMKGARR
jgi:hypothetical protein